MIKDLKTIIDRDDSLHEDDFAQAAQTLLTRQFLLPSRTHDRRYYTLIVQFQNYFIDLMSALNYQLVINEHQGYVGILPKNFVVRMRLEESLVLLSLRYIYDQEMDALDVEEDGSLLLSFEEFQDRYEQLTQRPIPENKSTFMAYLKSFSEHGIIKVEKDEDDPRVDRIRIYSTISALLSGDMLELIAGYLQAEDVEVSDVDADMEEE